jgi:hypothetical protein
MKHNEVRGIFLGKKIWISIIWLLTTFRWALAQVYSLVLTNAYTYLTHIPIKIHTEHYQKVPSLPFSDILLSRDYSDFSPY